MKKQNFRTLALIVCTFIYLLLGAGIFEALESSFENTECERLKKEQDELCGKYNISAEDFGRMTQIVMRSEPHRAGIQWKFTGSFYFATTVITTIGYGHSTPKTAPGKIFCMLYAMAGIPLNLVMFQSLGDRMNALATYIVRSVKKCFHFRRADVSQTLLIIISMHMSAIVLFGGAWAFSNYELWPYLDSFYYCVITLTTVGFGDFVALQKNQMLQKQLGYVIFSICFILFGLTVVSSAMNLLVLRFLTMNTVDQRRDERLAAIRRSTIQLASGVMSINGGGMLPLGTMLPTNIPYNDRNRSLAITPRTSNISTAPPIKTSRAGTSITSTAFIELEEERSSFSILSQSACLCCAASCASRRRQRYRVTRPPVDKVDRLLELGVASDLSSPHGSSGTLLRKPSQQRGFDRIWNENSFQMRHYEGLSKLKRSSSAERITRTSF